VVVIPFLVLGAHNISQFLNSKLSDEPQHPLLRKVSTTLRMLLETTIALQLSFFDRTPETGRKFEFAESSLDSESNQQ